MNSNIKNHTKNGFNDLYDKDLSVKLEGGMGTDFSYKNLTINAFMRFRIREVPGAVSANPGTLGMNQSLEVLNRWQKPGDKATYAKFTTQPTGEYSDFYSNSDGIYSSGSYIRLQNLSISYTLPEVWLKKVGSQAASFYIRGENLFVLTKYNGIDPDTPGFGTLPLAKIFTGGLTFTF